MKRLLAALLLIAALTGVEASCKLPNKYLSGYVTGRAKVYSTLAAAKRACLGTYASKCGGVTQEGGSRYTLRRGSVAKRSPSRENSWLASCLKAQSSVCSSRGPYSNKYLSGYVPGDNGKTHRTLAAALRACGVTFKGKCGGVTKERAGRYTLRRGRSLKQSPSREVSWLIGSCKARPVHPKCGVVYRKAMNKRWPHCRWNKCYGNKPLSWFVKECAKTKNCRGFSFTHGRTRGGGCLKQYPYCTGMGTNKGYGSGSHDYWTVSKKCQTGNLCSLRGPYSNKYLSGYVPGDNGKTYTTLAAARRACSTKFRGKCGGVTKERARRYTLRKGRQLKRSPSKEVSWLIGSCSNPWTGKPGGSYRRTCRSCSGPGNNYRCFCRTRRGTWIWDRINTHGCNKLHNINGRLMRDKSCRFRCLKRRYVVKCARYATRYHTCHKRVSKCVRTAKRYRTCYKWHSYCVKKQRRYRTCYSATSVSYCTHYGVRYRTCSKRVKSCRRYHYRCTLCKPNGQCARGSCRKSARCAAYTTRVVKYSCHPRKVCVRYGRRRLTYKCKPYHVCAKRHKRKHSFRCNPYRVCVHRVHKTVRYSCRPYRHCASKYRQVHKYWSTCSGGYVADARVASDAQVAEEQAWIASLEQAGVLQN